MAKGAGCTAKELALNKNVELVELALEAAQNWSNWLGELLSIGRLGFIAQLLKIVRNFQS